MPEALAAVVALRKGWAVKDLAWLPIGRSL